MPEPPFEQVKPAAVWQFPDNLPTRIPCGHCQQSGTCTNGSGRHSCEACVRYREGEQGVKYEDRMGMPCSVCKGRSTIEPTSLKIQNRLVPSLAVLFVLVAFYLIYFFHQTEHFDKVLVFAGTLIGSITGYYFGGEKNR